MLELLIVVAAVALAALAAISWTVKRFRCLKRRETACKGCALADACKKKPDPKV